MWQALEHAATVAADLQAELTVFVIALQAQASHRCGTSPAAYNCAILDEANAELHEAAQLLPHIGRCPRFTLLIEGTEPPLQLWVERERFDVVILPARRHVPGQRDRHPAARKLRSLGSCQVLIAPAGKHPAE